METSDCTEIYRLVFVGKSGSGKSTLINMITNILLKREYMEERAIAITQKLCLGDREVTLECNIPQFESRQSDRIDAGQCCSQTQHCQFYDYRTDDFQLTLVDTPGIVDTEGIEQDIENVKSIANAIGSMGEIHGIVIVHNGNDRIVDDTTKYLITEIRGLLSKEMKDNIIVMFTHTGLGLQTPPINSFKQMGINPKKVFTFDNDCFIPYHLIMDGAEEFVGSSNYRHSSQARWKHNVRSFNEFYTRTLNDLKASGASLVKIIQTNRAVMFEVGFEISHTLTAMSTSEINLSQQRDNLKVLQTISEQIIQFNLIDEQKLIKGKAKIGKRNVPVVVRSQITKNSPSWRRELMPDNEKCTICFNCRKSCHVNCRIDFEEVDGSMNFRACTAFEWHTDCQVCNHNYEYHGHRKYKYVSDVQKESIDVWTVDYQMQEYVYYDESGSASAEEGIEVDRIIQEMNERLEKATKDVNYAQAQITNAENELEDMKQNKESLIKIIAHLYRLSSEICDSPVNNFYPAYIKVCKTNILNLTSDEISEEDKIKKLASLDRLLKAYENIYDSINQHKEVPGLTTKEANYANNIIRRINKEDEEILNEYGRKMKISQQTPLECRTNHIR